MTTQGLEAFRQVFLAKEATKGTAITAAASFARLLGTTSLSPEKTWHTPVDERNSLAEYKRHKAIANRASLSFRGDATYDNLVPFFLMGLKGGVTSAPAVGSATKAKKWTFEPNLTSVNAQDSYTWVYGDNVRLFRSAFCQVQSLELASEPDGVVSLTSSMFGHYPVQFAPAGSYHNIVDPVSPEVIANHGTIYISDVSAGIWSEAAITAAGKKKDGLVTSVGMRFPTGLAPLRTVGGGGLNFSKTVERRRHYELDLEVLFDNADALTEYNAWDAGKLRVIRVEYEGPEIETVSGNKVNNKLSVQMVGRYGQQPQLFESREGQNTIRLSLMSMETLIDATRRESLVELVNSTA